MHLPNAITTLGTGYAPSDSLYYGRQSKLQNPSKVDSRPHEVQVYIARHHHLLHGRGAVMPNTTHTRMYVSTGQLSHFIDFITSAHIIQDLPLGNKKLKLSTNEEISVPNVISSIIPAQIIRQYEMLCSEEDFTSMGRSTLYRIMNVCSASVRKSLQGLDYFVAQGVRAFENLEETADRLGDNYGLGLSWSKEKKEQLKVKTIPQGRLQGNFNVKPVAIFFSSTNCILTLQ